MSVYSTMHEPKVSVVIPSYNGARWLGGCLAALEKQEYESFETILVDNGSEDESLDLVRATHPRVRVVALECNTGFAAAANRGVDASAGEHVALLNNDTVAQPGWLAGLVAAIDQSPPEVAAIQSKMLCLDDPARIDDAGDALSWTGAAQKLGHGLPAAEFSEPREIFSPCAGATLYRRSFLKALGGFDERFFSYLEDVDLGLRGRLLGYRYLFEPAAEVLHKGHGTGLPRQSYVRLMTRNRLLLFAKNIPLPLLTKHWTRVLYGQMYFAIAYRCPFQSVLGYVSFLSLLPHILRERGRLRASRRIELASLDAMLSVDMSEPPLGNPFRRIARLSR